MQIIFKFSNDYQSVGAVNKLLSAISISFPIVIYLRLVITTTTKGCFKIKKKSASNAQKTLPSVYSYCVYIYGTYIIIFNSEYVLEYFIMYRCVRILWAQLIITKNTPFTTSNLFQLIVLISSKWYFLKNLKF